MAFPIVTTVTSLSARTRTHTRTYTTKQKQYDMQLKLDTNVVTCDQLAKLILPKGTTVKLCIRWAASNKNCQLYYYCFFVCYKCNYECIPLKYEVQTQNFQEEQKTRFQILI